MVKLQWIDRITLLALIKLVHMPAKVEGLMQTKILTLFRKKPLLI